MNSFSEGRVFNHVISVQFALHTNQEHRSLPAVKLLTTKRLEYTNRYIIPTIFVFKNIHILQLRPPNKIPNDCTMFI